MTNETSGSHRKMLEAIVCPQTHDTLEYVAKDQELVNRRAGIAYPIRDGIPIMLLDEARRLDPTKC